MNYWMICGTITDEVLVCIGGEKRSILAKCLSFEMTIVVIQQNLLLYFLENSLLRPSLCSSRSKFLR